MSRNVLEVLSTGSFDMVHNASSRPASSSSQCTRPESQLSLQFLPPEEPAAFRSIQASMESWVEDQAEQKKEQAEHEEEDIISDLYSNIHHISEKIKNELMSHGVDSVGVESQEVILVEGLCDDKSPSKKIDVDEKLQKAIEKMAKLDAKLLEVIKKEKEVKKQTKQLHLKMVEGVDVSLYQEDGDLDPMLPVFATQPQDRENIQKVSNLVDGADEAGECLPECSIKTAGSDGATQQDMEDQGHHVDYVKRNIEVSGETGGIFAMTNAEKQRLEELMADVNSLEEALEEPNRMIVTLTSENGYNYSEQDMLRMKEIDSQLEALLPSADWESICFTPSALASSHSEQEHTLYKGLENSDLSQTLQEGMLSKEDSNRLRDIDEKLVVLQESRNQMDTCMPALSPSDLQQLLNQCIKELHGDTVVVPTDEPPICNSDS